MLPVASYLEMTGWVLPAKSGHELSTLTQELKDSGKWDRFEPFLRGGFWDNFLVKYPEANRIQKRMLRVSEKVDHIMDRKKRQEARQLLYKGQCNCAYWHGLFGGLYLNYLRDALTRNLIEAELIADTFNQGENYLLLENGDFDADGHTETILESQNISAVVKPSYGGGVANLDLRKYGFAISNVLTRRSEAYHQQVRDISDREGKSEDESVVSIHDIKAAKETGLSDHLILDDHDRLCFQDHVFHNDVTAQMLKDMSGLPENPFIESEYEVLRTQTTDEYAQITMEKQAKLESLAGEYSLKIEKQIRLMKNSPEIAVRYWLMADKSVDVRFGCENNLTLLTKDAQDRKLFIGDTPESFAETITKESISRYALEDGWQNFLFNVKTDIPATLLSFPIETVNQSEAGFERTYQGSALVLVYNLHLSPGQVHEINIRCTVTDQENR